MKRILSVILVFAMMLSLMLPINATGEKVTLSLETNEKIYCNDEFALIVTFTDFNYSDLYRSGSFGNILYDNTKFEFVSAEWLVAASVKDPASATKVTQGVFMNFGANIPVNGAALKLKFKAIGVTDSETSKKISVDMSVTAANDDKLDFSVANGNAPTVYVSVQGKDFTETPKFQLDGADIADNAEKTYKAEGYTLSIANGPAVGTYDSLTYKVNGAEPDEKFPKFTAVGEYTVTATYKKTGYNDLEVPVKTFKIVEASVDEITLTLDGAPLVSSYEWKDDGYVLNYILPDGYVPDDVSTKIEYKATPADYMYSEVYSIKDIGYYSVSVTFKKTGYETKYLYKEFQITEATFKNATLRLDNSNVDEDQKIPYDGDYHTVVLANVASENVTYNWNYNSVDTVWGSVIAPRFKDAGIYTIQAIANRTNYKTEEFNIVVTIDPLTASISDVTFEEKQYDGTTTATLKDYKLSGILDSEKDSVTVTTFPTFAFDNANAGTNKTVIADGKFVLSSVNYILAQPAASSLKGTITPIEVTVTPEKTANNKLVTDESDVEFGYTLGFAGTVADTLKITKDAFEGALAYDLGEDAAPVLNKEYPITVGTLELKDDYAQNYKVKFNQNGAYFKVIDKQYTKIELVEGSAPTKALDDYIEGQTFKPAGLSVKAFYLNALGQTEVDYDILEVTAENGFNWTSKALETTDEQVEISLEGAKNKITLGVEVSAKVLLGIEINKDEVKKTFKVGEAFSYETLKVYALYSNFPETRVELKTSEYEVEDGGYSPIYDPNSANDNKYKVTVIYEYGIDEKTATYTVEVVDKVVTDIEVTAGEGAVVNYIDNGKQTFKANGFVVKAFYDTDAANAEGTVVTDYTYTPDSTKILTVEDKKVTFSYTYGGKTITKDYPITVEENNATGIVVTKVADKLTYTEGNYFDPTGTVVKVTYLDGTFKLITGTVTKYCEANGDVYKEVDETYAKAGITFAPEKVQLNTTQITVSLGTLTAKKGIAITVNAKKVNDLEITEYAETAVDSDSAASVIKKVTAKFDNGDTETNFTAYTVSPATLTLTDKTAEQNIVVTVEYKNPGEELSYSDTVTVKVIPCEATNNNTGKNYASFIEAVAEANDGDVIELKNDVEITEDITVEKNITIKTGDNKLTTAEGVSLNTAKKVVVTFDTTGASADTVITVNGAEMTIAKDTTSAVAAKSDFSIGKQIMNAYSYIETFYRDITVVKSANGTISGRTKNKVGEDVKFTITPKAGYVVEDVIVDNVSVGAVTEYEFVNIRGDHTITAIFAEIAE